jgi:hypothetical protein
LSLYPIAAKPKFEVLLYGALNHDGKLAQLLYLSFQPFCPLTCFNIPLSYLTYVAIVIVFPILTIEGLLYTSTALAIQPSVEFFNSHLEATAQSKVLTKSYF